MSAPTFAKSSEDAIRLLTIYEKVGAFIFIYCYGLL